MPDPGPSLQALFKNFVQIGVIVADLDRKMQSLSEIFGIGPFRVIDWPPADRTDIQKTYHGRPADFTARMAFAELGPVELELIQPLTGASIWADFLKERGEGIHHILFNEYDLDPVLEHLAGHGIGPTQSGSGLRPGTSWTYFNTEEKIGFAVEVRKILRGASGKTPQIVAGRVQAES